MLHRLTLSTFLIAALITPAFGDTTIFFEDFESYADSSALLSAWPSSDPARPNNGTKLVPGDTAGDDNGPFYGGTNLTNFAEFCGSANDAIGQGNCGGFAGGGTVNLMNLDEPVVPTATQNLVFSADIGDDAFSANKRLTIGLRSTAPANLIEMGFYNVFALDTPHYGYRAILFESGDIATDPLNAGWDTYGNPNIDQPLPAELNSPFEVGRGFHRFQAEISLTDVTFSLDLYADGLRNDPLNPVPGEGTPGVDAFDVVPAVTNLTAGYNQIRFGPPSALASSGGTNIDAAFAAFDNISLKLVDIPVADGDADFNGDGVVDGRDFLVWQRGVGIDDGTAQLADGDANGDQLVDGADLAVWQGQYGNMNPPAAVAAVPEPSSLLLVAALGGLLACRRK